MVPSSSCQTYSVTGVVVVAMVVVGLRFFAAEVVVLVVVGATVDATTGFAAATKGFPNLPAPLGNTILL